MPQRVMMSVWRIRSSVAKMPLGTVSHNTSLVSDILAVKLNCSWQ